MRIRDGGKYSDPGWKKFGSGINIPIPRHCSQQWLNEWKNQRKRNNHVRTCWPPPIEGQSPRGGARCAWPREWWGHAAPSAPAAGPPPPPGGPRRPPPAPLPGRTACSDLRQERESKCQMQTQSNVWYGGAYCPTPPLRGSMPLTNGFGSGSDSVTFKTFKFFAY